MVNSNRLSGVISSVSLESAVQAELAHVRALGSSQNLVLACANLSVYELILCLLMKQDEGVPVYQALESSCSGFSSKSGIAKRVRMLREQGLITAGPGRKASEVRLRASGILVEELEPIIIARSVGRPKP